MKSEQFSQFRFCFTRIQVIKMLDKSWLENLILGREKTKRVVKCLEMTEDSLDKKNKNYTTDITRIKMSVELGSGEQAVMSFVAKKIPTSESMQEFHNEYRFMDEEIVSYENLIRMDQLMKDREDHRDNLWGHLEGRTDDVLVFEDLTAKGYEPYPSKSWLDEEHSKFVLRELARYHAMGIALIESNLVDPKRLKPLYIFHENAAEKIYKDSVTSFRDGVTTWGQDWNEGVKQLTRIIDEDLIQLIQRMDRVNRTTMNVISHGDCWKGNVLFKYDVLGQILSLKFVDFQMVAHCSYVYDLIVFLHSSVKPELRWNQLDVLLEAYRESLEANLKFYNLDSMKTPTLQEMKDTMKYLQPFSVLMLTMYWPVISNESEFKMSDAYDEGKTLRNSEMYTSQNCKNILGRELREMLKMDDFCR